MKRYNPKDVEPKWQKIWEESQLYRANDVSKKPKYYALSFFPYPSGVGLHIGHTRNFTITDVIARYKRLQGYEVLHPMGWDSFGLPAENFAIKTGTPPQVTTKQNTDNFRAQSKRLGLSIDWSREFGSTDADYYKWTQWFFLLLHKRDLAYRKESLQFWCNVCKTVLANEQVVNGCCWRHEDIPVTKKNLPQWFFKITNYADRLAQDLDSLDWPEGIKAMQRNWIGKSTGAEVDFQIVDSNEKLRVFTTRPDTLYGATYMVVAPEHPLLKEITTSEQRTSVDSYVADAITKTDIDRMDDSREKTGVFTGAYAVNPVNKEHIPIWVADYVLAGYGTGAIMAVPAHDERDHEFAVQYSLPIVRVVEPTAGEATGDDTHKESVFVALRNPANNTVLVLDWGPRQERFGGKMLIGGGVEGDESHQTTAEREIVEETGYKNLTFVKETDYKGHGYFYSNTKHKNMHVSGKGLLFDLIDEEQAATNLDEGEKNKFTIAWEPIEKVANLLDDGVHEAMYRDLVLGECYHDEGLMVNSGEYSGMSSSDVREKIVVELNARGNGEEKINFRIRDWLISRQRYWGAPIPIIHCEKCGTVPVPEEQLPVVLPELEDFQPKDDGRSPLAHIDEWVNVDCPECSGPATRETDTMDGFACSSWYFLRFTDPHNDSVAFGRELAETWMPVDMYVGGAEHAVMHLLYARMWTKVMHDVGLISFDEPFKALRNQGMLLAEDGEKISKSKGNDIRPEEIIDNGYGADALRLIVLFLAPYSQSTPWSNEGLGGVYRFLQRAWTITNEYIDASEPTSDTQSSELLVTRSKAVKKVTEDLEDMSFNTAIAAMMEYVNELYKLKLNIAFSDTAWKSAIEALVLMLAPFAPHMTEELWQQLGNKTSVHTADWPSWDDQLLATDTVIVVVQVNGKVRAEIEIDKNMPKDDALKLALQNEKVASFIADHPVKKSIYVPGRIINFVI